MDKLQIYEFPIENDIKLFMTKKNISYANTTFDANQLNKLSYVVSVKKNDNNRVNNKCSAKSILDDIQNSDNESTIMEYSHKSCDPLLFEYQVVDIDIVQNVNRTSIVLDEFAFDKTKFDDLYENIQKNLDLKKTSFLQYLVEGLILPELNYISCFLGHEKVTCEMGGFVTSNKNLKLHSMTYDEFDNTLTQVNKLWSTNITDPIFLEKKQYFDSLVEQIDAGALTIKDITFFPRIVHIRKDTFDKSNLCFFGDIHGSLHTLIRSLLRLVAFNHIGDDFIFRPDFHIFFLGDLIDRNIYGTDILFIIIKLYLLNPNQVHIIRGNHEEIQTNKRYYFYNEFLKLCKDIPKAHSLYFKYSKTWLYLPSAIFIKTFNEGYIQLCHGGFYKNAIFIKDYLSSDQVTKVIVDNNNVMDIQWSDYNCGNTDIASHKTGIYGKQSVTRGLIYTVNDSLEYMAETGIRSVIRGHQDFGDNTKVISPDKKLCERTSKQDKRIMAIEYINTKEMLTPSSTNSFDIVLPNLSDLDKFLEKYNFPPIITLSTGTTSRFIDCDGFAILNTSIINMVAGSSNFAKYNKYKNKYLNLKNKYSS